VVRLWQECVPGFGPGPKGIHAVNLPVMRPNVVKMLLIKLM